MRKIVVPTVVPTWLAGARMAAIAALLVAIVAEMIIWPRGLGGGLTESLHALAPARMWVYALTCGVVGYLLNRRLRQVVRLAADGGHPPTPFGRRPRRCVGWWRWRVRCWCGSSLGAAGDDRFHRPPSGSLLGDLHADGVLLPAIGHTVEVVVGLALATLLGVAVGVAIGASRASTVPCRRRSSFWRRCRRRRSCPCGAAARHVDRSGIVVVALVASWPILLETASAMRVPGGPSRRVAHPRAVDRRRWRKVVLPTLAPAILVVRIASALALIVALLVDILGAGKGIGRLLVASQQSFDAAAAWGLLLIVGGFGYLMSITLSGIAHVLEPANRRSGIPQVP